MKRENNYNSLKDRINYKIGYSNLMNKNKMNLMIKNRMNKLNNLLYNNKLPNNGRMMNHLQKHKKNKNSKRNKMHLMKVVVLQHQKNKIYLI